MFYHRLDNIVVYQQKRDHRAVFTHIFSSAYSGTTNFTSNFGYFIAHGVEDTTFKHTIGHRFDQ